MEVSIENMLKPNFQVPICLRDSMAAIYLKNAVVSVATNVVSAATNKIKEQQTAPRQINTF